VSSRAAQTARDLPVGLSLPKLRTDKINTARAGLAKAIERVPSCDWEVPRRLRGSG